MINRIDIILSTEPNPPEYTPIVDPYWDRDDWHDAARGDGHSYSGRVGGVVRLPGESDASLLTRADAECARIRAERDA